MIKKIFFLLLITQSLFAQEQYDFAVYHDGDVGAWEDGIVAFEQFLDWKGVSHNRVTAQDINTTNLSEFYKVIYFPGGDADYYNADINSNGIQNIKNFVFNNGAYIGMCAGAEFACDKLIWQGIAYDYPLDFFQGKAVGPIDSLAVWPGYDMVTLNMNLNDEINQFEPETEDMLYWGGSYFNAYEGTDYDTIATFNDYFDKPAIVKLNYGNGRVMLIAPHPEIEEDSDRDSVNVAQELNDNGSDWNFLWTATDWLLGNPLSEPNFSLAPSYPYFQGITLYPNPAKDILNISTNNSQQIRKVTIYNQAGQKLSDIKPASNSVDLSGFEKGVYIIEVEINNLILRQKLIIIE